MIKQILSASKTIIVWWSGNVATISPPLIRISWNYFDYQFEPEENGSKIPFKTAHKQSKGWPENRSPLICYNMPNMLKISNYWWWNLVKTLKFFTICEKLKPDIFQQFLAINCISIVQKPLYSPKLAPCDFFPFPKVKLVSRVILLICERDQTQYNGAAIGFQNNASLRCFQK